MDISNWNLFENQAGSLELLLFSISKCIYFQFSSSNCAGNLAILDRLIIQQIELLRAYILNDS